MFGGTFGININDTWLYSGAVLTPPANISGPNAVNVCDATVTYPSPTANGNAGTITCSPASGSQFLVGTTTVTCNASAGQRATFTVTVNDVQLPTIVAPANQILTTPAPAVATFGAPTIGDNCPGVALLGCSPASGSSFPAGSTTVTCTARDASAYTASASFTVTVPQGITVTTSPAGLPITVDGAGYTAPATFAWLPGTQHTIGTVPQVAISASSRNVFSNWSDGGAITHSITASASISSYVASFLTQHRLTTATDPLEGGTLTVSPLSGDGFYNAGTTVQVQANPVTRGFSFASWLGALAGSNPLGSILMDAPKSVTARFTPLSNCEFDLGKKAIGVLPSGDFSRVDVFTAADCAWTASTAANWITLRSAGGTGPGLFRFDVAANPSLAARMANVTIAGIQLTVVQSGAACTLLVDPSAVLHAFSTANGSVSVSTASDCQWAPSAQVSWLNVTNGGIRTGPGPFAYAVSSNSDLLPRIGTLSAGGQTIPVIQTARNLLAAFDDVPAGHPFFDPILMVVGRNIARGCGPRTYCPDQALTRIEMAEFLIRALFPSDNFTFPNTPYFTDVTGTNPRFKYVQKLRELGITAGCTANTFCPNASTNRGEMAFLVRARLGVTPTQTFPSAPMPFFTDVPATHPFFPSIQKLRELGVSTGCNAAAFCPSNPVTRGQMAAFAVRGLLAP
ncbi:MAG: S-layer homology domain-containing protein [Bryobacterales bacterium]|nr:S-layer homology domain-containing protein [Bryobacterales bacterium]